MEVIILRIPERSSGYIRRLIGRRRRWRRLATMGAAREGFKNNQVCIISLYIGFYSFYQINPRIAFNYIFSLRLHQSGRRISSHCWWTSTGLRRYLLKNTLHCWLKDYSMEHRTLTRRFFTWSYWRSVHNNPQCILNTLISTVTMLRLATTERVKVKLLFILSRKKRDNLNRFKFI